MKEQPGLFERFGAEWTPTLLVLDPDGKERHRIEGFLPVAELLGQLRLGLAHLARERGEFADAERRYRELEGDESAGDAAAEAQYWAGVSKYKRTNDPGALHEIAEAFRKRYRDTTWAKKASVWSS